MECRNVADNPPLHWEVPALNLISKADSSDVCPGFPRSFMQVVG